MAGCNLVMVAAKNHLTVDLAVIVEIAVVSAVVVVVVVVVVLIVVVVVIVVVAVVAVVMVAAVGLVVVQKESEIDQNLAAMDYHPVNLQSEVVVPVELLQQIHLEIVDLAEILNSDNKFAINE